MIDRRLIELRVEDGVRATYVDGAGRSAGSSPRPFLHPVTTRGGVTVTAAAPVDHTWHLGAGIAIPDVGGVNFWGGPTYTRSGGYTERNDQGRIVHQGWDELHPGSATERLTWEDRLGDVIVNERRGLRWGGLDDSAWWVEMAFELRAPGERSVELGSPGSKGREGAGYGGFFWRLPMCDDVEVLTAEGQGIEAAHGGRASWISLAARDRDGRDFTLLALGLDAASRADPWFVRDAPSGYAAIGSALAWESPLLTTPKSPVLRSFRIYILDGRVSREQAEALALSGEGVD